MRDDLIPQLAPLVERLGSWRGSLVEVVEQITRRPGSLDRHVTTRTSLIMRLEHVGIAFSGASLHALGRAFGREVGYEAACDLLDRLSIETEAVVLVERFGQAAERHTTFRRLPEAAAQDDPAPPPSRDDRPDDG